MSSPPVGGPPNPYAAPQGIGSPGGSPEQLSQANSAFYLGIGSMVVGLCCCPLIGLIMGVMAMNNANGIINMTQAGSEAHGKASTAKILGIVGIVLSVINMIAGGAISVMNALNQ